MRSIMITGALAAAFLTPAVLPATAAVPPSTCGYDNTTTAHLRSGPGSDRASLGLLRAGDDVDVSRESGGWYRVTLDGRSASGIKDGTTGWVAKRYVQPSVCTRLN